MLSDLLIQAAWDERCTPNAERSLYAIAIAIAVRATPWSSLPPVDIGTYVRPEDRNHHRSVDTLAARSWSSYTTGSDRLGSVSTHGEHRCEYRLSLAVGQRRSAGDDLGGSVDVLDRGVEIERETGTSRTLSDEDPSAASARPASVSTLTMAPFDGACPLCLGKGWRVQRYPNRRLPVRSRRAARAVTDGAS